jgi:hypothetical protein
MRNDARPIGEEFRDIAEHGVRNEAEGDARHDAKDREPAEGARRGEEPNVSSADQVPPDASER